MSKKNLVKKVIDNLIQDGTDFADLTQSELIKVRDLEGVSKTTIKRAKKEYKEERLANQRDYQEQNLKRKIYKYLDKRPKTSLADLREAMPGVPPAKVAEYHLYWRKKQEKAKQGKAAKKNRVSPRKLKEMVFQYLDMDNHASVETLYQKFPDAKQSSINSYFAGWKRKQKNTEKAVKGGLYEVIFKFLDKKPDATINDMKRAFSDVPVKSIEIYHNLWLKEKEERHRKEQNRADSMSLNDVVQEFVGDTAEPLRRRRGRPRKNPEPVSPQLKRKRGRPPGSSLRARNMSVDSFLAGSQQIDQSGRNPGDQLDFAGGDGQNQDAFLIQTMKKTIEAHNTTIFELEKEYRLLKKKQSSIIKELQAIPIDQIAEIRDFIVTYFKGMESA